MSEFNYNAIMELKELISEEIDIPAANVSDVFVDGNEIVFVINMLERFAADFVDGKIIPGTVQHIKSYEPLEEVDF